MFLNINWATQFLCVPLACKSNTGCDLHKDMRVQSKFFFVIKKNFNDVIVVNIVKCKFLDFYL